MDATQGDLLVELLDCIRDCDARKKAINEEVKSYYARASEGGLRPKAIKWILRDAECPQAEVEQDYIALEAYKAELTRRHEANAPPVVKAESLGPDNPLWDQGYKDGQAGNHNNPIEFGEPDYATYELGYQAGHNDRVDAELEAQQPRKRGRRKAA